MPYMFGLEYTRMTCDTCLRDCNADAEDMTMLNGDRQCEECRELCGGNCGEYLTDKTCEVGGPVVHYRDWVYDGKRVSSHASCAAETLLTYMDRDYSYDHTTRGETAQIVAPHYSAALVLEAHPDAVAIEKNGWFYVCKRMPIVHIDTSNVLGFSRVDEGAAWIHAGKEVRRAETAA